MVFGGVVDTRRSSRLKYTQTFSFWPALIPICRPDVAHDASCAENYSDGYSNETCPRAVNLAGTLTSRAGGRSGGRSTSRTAAAAPARRSGTTRARYGGGRGGCRQRATSTPRAGSAEGVGRDVLDAIGRELAEARDDAAKRIDALTKGRSMSETVRPANYSLRSTTSARAGRD